MERIAANLGYFLIVPAALEVVASAGALGVVASAVKNPRIVFAAIVLDVVTAATALADEAAHHFLVSYFLEIALESSFAVPAGIAPHDPAESLLRGEKGQKRPGSMAVNLTSLSMDASPEASARLRQSRRE